MLWRAYESVMSKLMCVSVEMILSTTSSYQFMSELIMILSFSVFTENLHCLLAEEKQFYPREEKVERKIAKGSERR